MRYTDQSWPQTVRVRTRRITARPARPGVHITCQLRPLDDPAGPNEFSSGNRHNVRIFDRPPVFVNHPEDYAANEARPNNSRASSYACHFTSAKGKVPRLHIYDVRKDRRAMERMANARAEAATTRRMTFNIPNTPTGDNKERPRVVIEIKPADNENGCVIGFDIRTGQDNRDPLIINTPTEASPVDLTVEALKLEEDTK